MKQITSYLRFAILLSVFAVTSQVQAMKSPDLVVKETVDSMVSQLQNNRALYASNTQALYDMLEQTLVPALNVPRMADLILGRDVAKSSSSAQKKAFADEFKAFLLQSYATGLLNATGEEKVLYQPISLKPGADRVKVKATLISGNGAQYPIVLSMSNRGDTQWRAYNMEVVGINVIRTYKASFAATLQQKGIDGLIADLRTKNGA